MQYLQTIPLPGQYMKEIEELTEKKIQVLKSQGKSGLKSKIYIIRIDTTRITVIIPALAGNIHKGTG